MNNNQVSGRFFEKKKRKRNRKKMNAFPKAFASNWDGEFLKCHCWVYFDK